MTCGSKRKGVTGMLQAGDRLVYGSHGVCSVLGLEYMSMGKAKGKYYILEPVDQPGARFYVPADNISALEKLRPLLSGSQIQDVLESRGEAIFIQEENRRRQFYRELLSSGDREQLFLNIKLLRREKERLLAEGKKFHLCDENFLKDAQKVLVSEFSVVLALSHPETLSYMEKYLK